MSVDFFDVARTLVLGPRRCPDCGFFVEALLDYEMQAGGRGDTELCRMCFDKGD